jgi:hypothetical protein
MTTLEAREIVSRAKPAFVKYISAISPSTSCDTMEGIKYTRCLPSTYRLASVLFFCKHRSLRLIENLRATTIQFREF